jgi:hypothetical protein
MSCAAERNKPFWAGEKCRLVRCPREAKLVAENQQLRDALYAIADRDFGGELLSPDEAAMREIARKALAGTPSEDA